MANHNFPDWIYGVFLGDENENKYGKIVATSSVYSL